MPPLPPESAATVCKKCTFLPFFLKGPAGNWGGTAPPAPLVAPALSPPEARPTPPEGWRAPSAEPCGAPGTGEGGTGVQNKGQGHSQNQGAEVRASGRSTPRPSSNAN